jgi:outer membrane autotransporter protein
LDVGGYLDARYTAGFVAFSARYTHLQHESRRSVEGIDGLQVPWRVGYGGAAVSARVEHGFSFTARNGLVVQPLFPVIDYVRLSATHFDEGAQAGALRGRAAGTESLRVGAGLQLYRTFSARGGEQVTPHLRVLWQRELGHTQLAYDNALAAAPEATFGVKSQALARQSVAWNLGITTRASARLSIALDYVGERGSGHDQNAVMLGLGYRF